MKRLHFTYVFHSRFVECRYSASRFDECRGSLLLPQAVG
jgi:hypothetical protein